MPQILFLRRKPPSPLLFPLALGSPLQMEQGVWGARRTQGPGGRYCGECLPGPSSACSRAGAQRPACVFQAAQPLHV